ncbi:hypothetical protein BV20DRAFT_1054235 [Pilatotrama ljubarskyi]|nr:hypothetical protein BV20DRAFT_1054235 [Pilatotrama ljubarskyi]
MSQKAEPYKGPWIVKLGGYDNGIYRKEHPSGREDPSALLPILVTCAYEQDAELIDEINDGIIAQARPNDNHTIVWKCQQPPVSTFNIAGKPIWAIRRGVQTGIWIGFNWAAIAYLINNYQPRSQTDFCKANSLSEALTFMLFKPGYTLPMLPPGVPVPPPPGHEDGDDSGQANDDRGYDDDGNDDNDNRRLRHDDHSNKPRKPSTPAPASAYEEDDDDYVDAASYKTPPSPSKRTTPRPALSTPAKPKTPLKPALARSTPPAPSSSSARAHVRFEAGSSITTNASSTGTRASTRSTRPSENNARRTRGESRDAPASVFAEDETPGGAPRAAFSSGRDYLGQIIRPPSSMLRSNKPCRAITLGPLADARLAANSCSAVEQLTILQIYVHSQSVETFAYHLVMSLRWDIEECNELWEEIILPEL